MVLTAGAVRTARLNLSPPCGGDVCISRQRGACGTNRIRGWPPPSSQLVTSPPQGGEGNGPPILAIRYSLLPAPYSLSPLFPPLPAPVRYSSDSCPPEASANVSEPGGRGCRLENPERAGYGPEAKEGGDPCSASGGMLNPIPSTGQPAGSARMSRRPSPDGVLIPTPEIIPGSRQCGPFISTQFRGIAFKRTLRSQAKRRR